jgi:hypothetical protein
VATTLGELESQVLIMMQQQGVAVNTDPLAAPNWGTLLSPQFSQGVVDFCINKAYQRMAVDLAEYEIYLDHFLMPSVSQSFSYTVPPAPTATHADIAVIQRVFYAPTGLNYTYEFRPGYNLISWGEFQKQTGDGYFLQTGASSSTIPTFCALFPDRKSLWFYPGTANAGDAINVYYAPIPTASAILTPTLVAQTDAIKWPADCGEAIVQWALVMLWQKARSFQNAAFARQSYDAEIKRLKTVYDLPTKGDVRRFDILDWTSAVYPTGY